MTVAARSIPARSREQISNLLALAEGGQEPLLGVYELNASVRFDGRRHEAAICYRTTTYTITSVSALFHNEMSLKDSYSKLKDGFKRRLKGKKHELDGTTFDGVNSTESLSQPEPHVPGGSGRDRGGDGDSAHGRHTGSTDRRAQHYESETTPAGESENDQEGGTTDSGGEETNQTRGPVLRPDIELMMESGGAERVHPQQSVTIPLSAPLDGKRTSLF